MTNSDLIIRNGREDDVQTILPMCFLIYASSIAKKYNYGLSLRHAGSFLNNAIHNDYAVFLVAEKEGRIIGFIVGVAIPYHFDPTQLELCEVEWWVHEDERTTRAGVELLHEFEERARDMKCSYVKLMFQENEVAKRMECLYDRLGYSCMNRIYVKEI